MNIHPYIAAIGKSFYSADLYKEVGKYWRGYGIGYIFTLLGLMNVFLIFSWVVIVSALDPQGYAKHWTDNIFEHERLTVDQGVNRWLGIIADIPPMTIHNGTLSTDVAQPYTIHDPITTDIAAIIDTTGTYKTLADSKALMLVTGRQLLSVSRERAGVPPFNFSELSTSDRFDESDANILLGVVAQIPKMRLSKGELTTTEAITQPYEITTPALKTPLAVIDTSGKYLTPANTPAPLLITKERIYVAHPFDKDYTTIFLPDMTIATITDLLTQAAQFVKHVLVWFIPFIALPILLVSSLILFSLLMGVYGAIGLVMVRFIENKTLDFPAIVRLAAVAITPVALGNIILPRILDNQGLVYFLISIGYLYYAIKVNSEDEEKEQA